MKRNLDLMRQILLAREASDKLRIFDSDIANTIESLKETNYNIQLLDDAGYIETKSHIDRIELEDGRLIPLERFEIYRLTNAGHDYLDSVRDDEIYKKIKQKLGPHITSATLDVIKHVSESILLKLLNI